MTRYLFDTHLLIWMLSDTAKLSVKARQILSDADGLFYFSPVSVWEVGIKRGKHPDQLPFSAQDFRTLLRESGLREMPITSAHTAATESLPEIHGDPFDRLLIAQAQVESAKLITHDGKLASYGYEVVSV